MDAQALRYVFMAERDAGKINILSTDDSNSNNNSINKNNDNDDSNNNDNNDDDNDDNNNNENNNGYSRYGHNTYLSIPARNTYITPATQIKTELLLKNRPKNTSKQSNNDSLGITEMLNISVVGVVGAGVMGSGIAASMLMGRYVHEPYLRYLNLLDLCLHVQC